MTNPDSVKRMARISIDFETFNTIDLRKVGAEVYTSSKDLTVTVIAWALDDSQVQSETCPTFLPSVVQNALIAGYKLHAWNANFEWLILKNYFQFMVPWEQVRCTMQRALHAGLPGKLEDAGMALGLDPAMLKDNANHGLMMSMSRPRRSGSGKWHVDDPSRLAKLEAYCRQDVVAEREIGRRIPELTLSEQRVSDLDHRANQRGVMIDSQLAQKLSQLAQEETHRLNQACAVLTSGEVTSPGTQTMKLRAWLADQGVIVPASLDKDHLAELLDPGSSNRPWLLGTRTAVEVLEIRQEVAMSSVAKLKTMGQALGADSRVRGQLQYYGAGRTGRFSGRLIQPQNMPKPTLPKKVLAQAIQDIRAGCSAEWIDLTYGPPLKIVREALRSCIVPGKDKIFVIYDFNQIEARVIAWMAGQGALLDTFRRGEDIYVRAQKRMGLASRLHGKVVCLACGYGMGPSKFVDTARKYGLHVSQQEATDLVYGWRKDNPEIVDFWHESERAARRALFEMGKRHDVQGAGGKVSFKAVHSQSSGQIVLCMALPSGRQLFYRNARIADDEDSALTYDGVNQVTRRWTDIRTWGGKLVENAVQACARDVLCDAMLRVEDKALGDVVLSIHDEIIVEIDDCRDAADKAKLIQAEIDKPPFFAADLPIGTEGGIKTSYGV